MWSFCLIVVAISTAHASDVSTTEAIQTKIDAGIDFLCKNQVESSGHFLYDTNTQNVGLYALGMYHRLNPHKDMKKCIDMTIGYLSNHSLSITLQKNDAIAPQKLGELIMGGTGSTALAILGLTEICTLSDDHFCAHYIQQLKAWTNGLLTMREYKILSNTNDNGLFAETIQAPTDYNKEYDAESYLALCRLIKYKQTLLPFIHFDDALWRKIDVAIKSLDEYYIQNDDDDNDTAHWIVESLHDRWITLPHNPFSNYFLIKLMKQRMENVMQPSLENVTRCHLIAPMIDTLHALQVSVDSSHYKKQFDSMHEFHVILRALIDKRFAYILKQSLFENDIDESAHCLVALMKFDLFYNHLQDEDDDIVGNVFVYGDGSMDDDENETNYDIMISVVCLIVIIFLVALIFGYWCYCYPKQQKRRNDEFWCRKMSQQIMESCASDIDGYID